MATAKDKNDKPAGAPEDLSPLSDDELSALQDSLRARADEIATPDADLSDAEIDEVERLVGDVERIGAQITANAEAATARQERLNTVLSKLHPAEPEVETDDAEVTDEGDGEPVDAEVVEIQAEVEDAETEAPLAIAASATARTARVAPRPAPMTARPRLPKAPAAAKPPTRPRDFMKATNLAAHRKEGDSLANTFDVAKAICDTKVGWTRPGSHTGRGTRDYVAIATGRKSGFAHEVSADPRENYGAFQALLGQFSQKRGEDGALVAAVGCRAPLTPIYDFYRTAVVQTPIEDDLPTVQAPRGGVRWIRSPDYSQALLAVGDFDNNEADPDDKPCLTASCPAEETAYVTAVTKCVQFDNLEYTVFPELVEDLLEDSAVIFAQHKETKYLDYINLHSTAVSSDPGYGTALALLYSWETAATQYRKRRQMRRDAMLKAYLPDWVLNNMKIDMGSHGYGGLDYLGVTDQQVEAQWRSRGLDPVWINDAASVAPNQLLRAAQAAGTLNPWPTTVTGYLFAPGVFGRMDGGTLDVGLVRDSLLNKQNNLQLFYEEWNGMWMPGNESIRLTTTICASGGAAALSTLRTCA